MVCLLDPEAGCFNSSLVAYRFQIQSGVSMLQVSQRCEAGRNCSRTLSLVSESHNGS